MVTGNLPSQFTQTFLGLVLFLWVIVEYRIVIRQNKRPLKKDLKSILLFAVITIIFTIVSIALLQYKASNITHHKKLLFYSGIFIIVLGIIFRQYCVHLMGTAYVATLQIQTKPKLITNGPFKFIRHPCYTGFMVSLWGLGLSLLNLYLFVLLIIFSICVFLIQIHIEEIELKKFFGKEYEEYAKTTKKLMPYIL